jgi:hypothetical protein
MNSDFLFEYEYIPTPDAEERLAQAWDIFVALILEDYEEEQQAANSKDTETC